MHLLVASALMDALEHQLPDLAAGLARSVHSGATLPVAIAEVADSIGPPARADLTVLSAKVRRGVGLDEALVQWDSSRGSPGVALLVAACRIGHAEGGDLASALDGVAAALLDRVQVADETRALTSQARASAFALAVLPLLGLVAFSLLEPRVPGVLLTTRVGLACLGLGVVLESLGVLCLARMVDAALK